MEKPVCISTNQQIANDYGSVQFLCPKCGEFTITRSNFARKRAMKYTCPKCEFEGPN